MNKQIRDPLIPAEMTMHVYSPNAEALNDDPEWMRARVLLGSLFQKHGPFSIEILKKGIWVGTKNVQTPQI
jgi:hypothetical protein